MRIAGIRGDKNSVPPMWEERMLATQQRRCVHIRKKNEDGDKLHCGP
jgi:hypothetical protein